MHTAATDQRRQRAEGRVQPREEVPLRRIARKSTDADRHQARMRAFEARRIQP
jgi:hypothetical protein